MKRGIVILVLLALFPASASAHRSGHDYPMAMAIRHAYELWGRVPCGGHYSIEVGPLPAAYAGEAWVDECRAVINPEYWKPLETPLGAGIIASDWPDACVTVMHEYGHLLGYGHTDQVGAQSMTLEQQNVMQSGLGNYPGDLHRCGWEP